MGQQLYRPTTTRLMRNVVGSAISSRAAMRMRALSGAGKGAGLTSAEV
jgi:hypothetical protein